MPQALIGAVAAPIVGGLVGKALGPKQSQTQAQVPQDLQGLRGGNIGLLQYLTGAGGQNGFNPQTGQWGSSQPQLPGGGMGQGSPGQAGRGAQAGLMGAFGGNNNMSLRDFAQGGFGNLFQRAQGSPPQQGGMGGPGGAVGGPTQRGGSDSGANFGGPTTPGGFGVDADFGLPRGPVGGNPLGQAPGQGGMQGGLQERLGNYFGNMGVGVNNLQNTAAQSANRMLTQQSPEQRALEAAFPSLQQTGLNQNAMNRLDQGANQSGLPGASNNYYQNLLQNGAGDLGPGSDVQSLLRQLGQSGGNLTQLPGIMGGGSGAEGFLQQLLGKNPAQGVDGLLQGQYEKNLALANQAGGRFGTANALQRGDVAAQQNVDLANRMQQGVGQQLQGAGLLGQLVQNQRGQMLQASQQQVQNQLNAANSLGGFNQQGALAGLQGQLQGAGALGSLGLQDIGQQLGAAGQLGQQGLQGQQNILQGANTMGNLAGQAGNADRQNITNAFGIGSGLAGQQDIETQRNLGIIMNLLGVGQQASLNQPNQTTPSGFQQGAGFGGQLAQIIAAMSGGGGGGGGATGGGGAGWDF